MQQELLKAAKAFYEEAAIAASALGVSIDLYAVSPLHCGLDALEPLAGSTGGSLHLYASIDRAALPQVTAKMPTYPQSMLAKCDRANSPGNQHLSHQPHTAHLARLHSSSCRKRQETWQPLHFDSHVTPISLRLRCGCFAPLLSHIGE